MTQSNADRSPADWTQEDAISYECAGEAITHAMAIVSAEIDDIEEGRGGGRSRLTHLSELQTGMASERASLHRLDPDAIKAVRVKYNALVRAGRRGTSNPSA